MKKEETEGMKGRKYREERMDERENVKLIMRGCGRGGDDSQEESK